ncbi:tRNA (adenosine(37)-N6)-threonylcarbamoyltransferase complex transferase subunit TsaD [Candidatus Collierbacteria bacterium RIFOXYD1_FULL_40_9]|uniref:tRNA N6-adenosine threonylcarbamoyltransferase n=1 Tax=Candidatus Collierbacteria bacterium RIFOXYD1_FULL_40_9 TaxID=1817731 RepID=A0A1F5FVU4_9BACT|nr:MAG: tRNA (adenosine(37)-N6)-threonylcarbamoyltransferase complex transferase subunit TsaD [Candidatus Collierbacteria bacterium RIFOXYD1_FULL_40_9]
MKVLAIESTLDETAASVVESSGSGVGIVSSVVASSANLHVKYGGVVPEIAAREQLKLIIPVLMESIGEQEINEIDAVAAAFGPGMMGCLLIGVETAKALAWVWNKPLLKVNHIGAHLLANWIIDLRSQMSDVRLPEFPAVGLVASGGHTDFFLMENVNDWKWIGGTRDDAVGEAFDKAGRIFGLPYPAGPAIDKISKEVSDEEYKELNKEDKLPRPLIHDKTLDMSFSGLKAAVARAADNRSLIVDSRSKNIMIRDFSEAVTEVLVAKTKIALEKYKPKSLLLGGGVAANSKIREALKKLGEEFSIPFFVPELKYCGDNAAMIGAAAIMRPVEASFDDSPEPGMDVV